MSNVCHTIPTKNGPVCSLLPGWTTASGKLLGPNMALDVIFKYTYRATASGVETRFCNLSIIRSALYTN